MTQEGASAVTNMLFLSISLHEQMRIALAHEESVCCFWVPLLAPVSKIEVYMPAVLLFFSSYYTLLPCLFPQNNWSTATCTCLARGKIKTFSTRCMDLRSQTPKVTFKMPLSLPHVSIWNFGIQFKSAWGGKMTSKYPLVILNVSLHEHIMVIQRCAQATYVNYGDRGTRHQLSILLLIFKRAKTWNVLILTHCTTGLCA
jgi:hypothetical protein